MKDVNVLISKEEINKKLDEMAEILDRDYEGKVITVLSVYTVPADFLCSYASSFACSFSLR